MDRPRDEKQVVVAERRPLVERVRLHFTQLHHHQRKENYQLSLDPMCFLILQTNIKRSVRE